MFRLLRPTIITCLALIPRGQIAFSQGADKTESDSVRVTMSVNADGSRTVYRFDDAQHEAEATTTGQDGKLRQKIRYVLDNAGRFSSGLVFGPDGRLRFKSLYKYDAAGRLQEETQTDENDAVLHKIVYSYSASGKQTGYSVFDASGKLIARTVAPTPAPTASPKSHQKKGR